jgi:hypothetical protein
VHVVRIDTTDAAGKLDSAFCGNANTGTDGSGKFSFPLAEEDAGRELTVSVHDILSGATATAKVALKKE